MGSFLDGFIAALPFIGGTQKPKASENQTEQKGQSKTYDKNSVFEALNREDARIGQEYIQGYGFCTLIGYYDENGNGIEHILADTDFDEIVDSYRYIILEKDTLGNSKYSTYFDDDFDGTFDFASYEYEKYDPRNDSISKIYAMDEGADGTIDSYEY